MTADRPDVRETSLYTQAQAARALGVHRHTIKSYEDAGLMRFRLRRADNRRVTTGKDILSVWTKCY